MNTAQKIATGWVAYATRNDLNPKTQTYHKAMHAFVNGCNVLAGEHGLPPIIQIYIMSGRDIAEITKEHETA